jgi:hypothetical protein
MYAALRSSSKNWANKRNTSERFRYVMLANVGLFTLNVLACMSRIRHEARTLFLRGSAAKGTGMA